MLRVYLVANVIFYSSRLNDQTDCFNIIIIHTI